MNERDIARFAHATQHKEPRPCRCKPSSEVSARGTNSLLVKPSVIKRSKWQRRYRNWVECTD